MHLRDLPAERAIPLEAVHYTRWLNNLLERAPATASCGSSTAASDLKTIVASRPGELEAAEELVRRRYAWRGYLLASPVQRAEALQAHSVTLLAQADGKLLGTLTVRRDSEEEGLLAENTYPAEIGHLRGQGRRIGELTKLAVEEGADWKAALDALVQSAYLVTRMVHALTDVVIEVNPRHVRFYQRVFGFVTGAAERMCTRVAAPSVLLLLDLEEFGRRLQLAGNVI